ncbi:hypothetical protein TorRG33x02_122840 [Trema orientale]|uniref:Uncharacterized protein n=1 Tax=Trema orientale TaxID=63057 RepID=A0A2P5F2D8_TREOI|nr:hypothetical protein TorRG33x02_122840 [Trema orientale]
MGRKLWELQVISNGKARGPLDPPFLLLPLRLVIGRRHNLRHTRATAATTSSSTLTLQLPLQHTASTRHPQLLLSSQPSSTPPRRVWVNSKV